MKSAILVVTWTVICASAFAQTDSVRDQVRFNDENRYDDEQNDRIGSNCAVTMTNGKMMIEKSGQFMVMDKDMVMRNGTIISLDGTVRTKDGATIRIQEGDCLDRSGRIVVKDMRIKENPQSIPQY